MSANSDAAQSYSTSAHAQQPTAATSHGTDAQLHLPDCHMADAGNSATEVLREAMNTDEGTVTSLSQQASILHNLDAGSA